MIFSGATKIIAAEKSLSSRRNLYAFNTAYYVTSVLYDTTFIDLYILDHNMS